MLLRSSPFLALALAVALAAPAEAGPYCPNTTNSTQPRIGISGSAFTVDRGAGPTPEFLLMLSAFGVLRLPPATQCDVFKIIRDNQFQGVRIFPNWWWTLKPDGTNQADLLFNANGVMPEASYQALLAGIRRAGEHGLIVDLSFAVEINGYAGWYVGAMHNLITRLRNDGAPNVMIDLQNEASLLLPYQNPVCPGGNCWAWLLSAMKLADPARIMTFSIEPNGGYGPFPYSAYQSAAAGHTANHAFVSPYTGQPTYIDVATLHDGRDYGATNWWQQTSARVQQIRNVTSKPVYFQEPDRWMPATVPPARPEPSNVLTAANFREAAARAKLAGAAAWLFHTEGLFCLQGACLSVRGPEGEAIATLGGHVAARCSPVTGAPAGCTWSP